MYTPIYLVPVMTANFVIYAAILADEMGLGKTIQVSWAPFYFIESVSQQFSCFSYHFAISSFKFAKLFLCFRL